MVETGPRRGRARRRAGPRPGRRRGRARRAGRRGRRARTRDKAATYRARQAGAARLLRRPGDEAERRPRRAEGRPAAAAREARLARRARRRPSAPASGPRQVHYGVGHARPAPRELLLTPGPTPVPPDVVAAMARPLPHHRTREFKALFGSVLERLKPVFRTERDVMLFTSSGTGAFESAYANLVSPGDRVLVVSAGNFGERWVQDGAGLRRRRWRRCAGRGASGPTPTRWRRPSNGRERPRAGRGRALRDVDRGRCSTCRPSPSARASRSALLVVDAISSLGAAPLETDAWGLDVVVTGSQKALMLPPGPGLRRRSSERALERSAQATSPRFYFDWQRTCDAQRKGPQSAFTPAISLILGLDAALDRIEADGLGRCGSARRAHGHGPARPPGGRWGSTCSRPTTPTAALVTAFSVPEGLDGDALRAGAARPSRHRRRRRPGRAQGPHPALRRVRLHRAARPRRRPRRRWSWSSAAPGIPSSSAPASAPSPAPSRRTRRWRDGRPRARRREDRRAGVQHLSGVADVDVALELERAELLRRIGDYDALVVRSATKVDAELIAAAERLRVVGRAGTAWTTSTSRRPRARGILVCNAPQSNVLSAAEHADRADARAGAQHPGGPRRAGAGPLGAQPLRRASSWPDKTLGVLGFGRIGQLVAARGPGARHARRRLRPVRHRRAPLPRARAPSGRAVDEALAAADCVTLHLPATAETRRVDRRRRARADEARRPPRSTPPAATSSTPRRWPRRSTLGPRRRRRARRVRAGAAHGVAAASSCRTSSSRRTSARPPPRRRTAPARSSPSRSRRPSAAALVENAVNTPVVHEEDRAALGPFLPLADKLGRVVAALSAGGGAASRVTYEGQLAGARHAAAHPRRCWSGVLRGWTRA